MSAILQVTLKIVPRDASVPRRARLMVDPADPPGMKSDDGTAYDAREVAMGSTDGNTWAARVRLPSRSPENTFVLLMFSASPGSTWEIEVESDRRGIARASGTMKAWKERWHAVLPAPR